MRRVLLLLVLLLGLAAGLLSEPPGADLVLTNGNIYTVDSRLGRVEALAISRGKIAAVGTAEEIQHWVGAETKVVDLEGKFVMPGFNDAHVHLEDAGKQLLTVNVGGTRSLAEFQQLIRDRMSDFQPGEWVTGRGWDHSLWKENRVPTRADLDAVSTDHPMFFTRLDGHSTVANSRALEQAGITRDTPDPEGGKIVRDAAGDPTGWLKDNAIALVEKIIPEPTPAQRKRRFSVALTEAARFGATSLQDDSIRSDFAPESTVWENFLALRELKQEGKLTARITEWLPFEAPFNRLEKLRKEGGATDPWLKTGALKAETDGSGGSLSAAMFEPFANTHDNRGFMKIEPERLRKMVVDRDAAGFQIALHAIGDRANRVVLDAFEAALKVNKRRNARHMIVHAQFVHRDDVARFKELGIIASAQPCHLLADMRWAPTILGPEREHEAYAWNALQKAGARLAFGTDYPVEHINPLRGIYAAVAREFEDGGPEGGWLPEEKISIEEAIRAYTAGSAFAEFEEHRKGTLAPGKFADLIVLSQDITRVPTGEILRTEVLLTVVGGKVVYERE